MYESKAKPGLYLGRVTSLFSKGVKTITKNISLSQELAPFASAEVEEGGFGSVSAYFADLLRQRRQAQIDEDLTFLKRAMADAPGEPEPVAEVVSATKAARRQMRKDRWKP